MNKPKHTPSFGNPVTHVLYQAHTGIEPYGICAECDAEFNKRNNSHWDFTAPLETSTSRPINKTCLHCKSKFRHRAWLEARILWHVFKDGVYQFSTTDKHKAFADKKNRDAYERTETILKAGGAFEP